MKQDNERIDIAMDERDHSSQSDADGQDFDVLRSLLRLLVGGTEIGVEELRKQLQSWEESTPEEVPEEVAPDIIEIDMESGDRIYRQPLAELHEDAGMDAIRYALIGLLFEVQEGMRSSIDLAGRLTHAVRQTIKPWWYPMQNSRLLTPLISRYDSLVARGEAEVTRWIETGRKESHYSRNLSQVAIAETINRVFEYLSENQEIRELIQSQGTGLADEVLEEARERTVSADTYLEGVIRSILRRTPRRELPEPSEAEKQQALTFRELRDQRTDEL